MKTKICITTACLALLSGLFLYSEGPSTYNIMEDVAFENIEALAGSESSTDYICVGEGSIDCHGEKVKYAMSNYSLK